MTVGQWFASAGIILAIGLLVVPAGSWAITQLFRRVDRGTPAQTATTLRGGRWIGMLERSCIYATILASWPEGVAVVVAIKGLGRYGELRTGDPRTAERFIIGSLASLLLAGAGALLARWLVTLV